MVRGFRLKAHTEIGEEAVKEFEKADRRALVKRISDKPLIVSFVFKPRYQKAITEMSIKSFLSMTMKSRGCKDIIDYTMEVLE